MSRFNDSPIGSSSRLSYQRLFDRGGVQVPQVDQVRIQAPGVTPTPIVDQTATLADGVMTVLRDAGRAAGSAAGIANLYSDIMVQARRENAEADEMVRRNQEAAEREFQRAQGIAGAKRSREIMAQARANPDTILNTQRPGESFDQTAARWLQERTFDGFDEGEQVSEFYAEPIAGSIESMTELLVSRARVNQSSAFDQTLDDMSSQIMLAKTPEEIEKLVSETSSSPAAKLLGRTRSDVIERAVVPALNSAASEGDTGTFDRIMGVLGDGYPTQRSRAKAILGQKVRADEEQRVQADIEIIQAMQLRGDSAQEILNRIDAARLPEPVSERLREGTVRTNRLSARESLLGRITLGEDPAALEAEIRERGELYLSNPANPEGLDGSDIRMLLSAIPRQAEARLDERTKQEIEAWRSSQISTAASAALNGEFLGVGPEQTEMVVVDPATGETRAAATIKRSDKIESAIGQAFQEVDAQISDPSQRLNTKVQILSRQGTDGVYSPWRDQFAAVSPYLARTDLSEATIPPSVRESVLLYRELNQRNPVVAANHLSEPSRVFMDFVDLALRNGSTTTPEGTLAAPTIDQAIIMAAKTGRVSRSIRSVSDAGIAGKAVDEAVARLARDVGVSPELRSAVEGTIRWYATSGMGGKAVLDKAIEVAKADFVNIDGRAVYNRVLKLPPAEAMEPTLQIIKEMQAETSQEGYKAKNLAAAIDSDGFLRITSKDRRSGLFGAAPIEGSMVLGTDELKGLIDFEAGIRQSAQDEKYIESALRARERQTDATRMVGDRPMAKAERATAVFANRIAQNLIGPREETQEQIEKEQRTIRAQARKIPDWFGPDAKKIAKRIVESTLRGDGEEATRKKLDRLQTLQQEAQQ